jgi:hypothetical protein
MAPHVFGGMLTEKDRAMLERCGIPLELAEEAARRVDSVTGAAMFGRRSDLADYAGIVFLDRLPGESEIREYTLRRDHPDLEDAGNGKVKEKNKYVSPPGRSNLLYFAPRTAPEWLEDTTLPVIVTEGPKKCLALSHLAWEGVSDATDKPRWLSVGLRGVWSWRGKVGKEDGPDGERQDIKGPIPDLNRIEWTKREVVVVFDTNVHSNESIRVARASLAAELRNRGARVLFVDLPNADASINGIDDYIGKYGSDAALKLITGAYDPQKKKSDSGQPSKIVIGNLPDVCHIASEKVEFLVPGLLVKGTLTVLSGEASAGKTTLALWLADLIARGAAVFGERCQQHPVLYLTRENPVDYMADIVRRLKIKNGQDSNLHIWGDWVEESAPAPAAAHILAWVSDCQPPPFVIIDSLIAFFDGKNENDSAEMRAFLNQGRALMRAGACGVLFLHHPGKAESAKVYRGSSDLGPAIDAGYVLHNSGDGILERLHLKLFKPRFLAQKRELLLNYREGTGFVSEERPAVVQQSRTQLLSKLLASMPRCTAKEFEDAAQRRGEIRWRAREFLKNGIDNGSIQLERGAHNKCCHSLASPDRELIH